MPEQKVDVRAIDENGLELSESEVQSCIKKLRELVLGESNLNLRTDDNFMLRFLHCTYFNVEDAFNRLKDYYKLKQNHPEWFASTPPSDHEPLLSRQVKTILEDRDIEGRRVFLVKLGRVDTSKTTMQLMSQLDELWIDSVLEEPETQATGISVILDMSGYSWKLFKWLTPGNVKVATKKAETLPVKTLHYHVVNSSMLLNAAVAIVFPFLSNKTKEQVRFHYEDWPSLHKYISPSALPKEYGGSKEVDFNKSQKILFDKTDILLKTMKCGYGKKI